MAQKRPTCQCSHAHSSHTVDGCGRCKCVEYRERSRRTKGDGALFQRADGKWMGRVELPKKGEQRRYKWVSSIDRNTAMDKLKKLRKDVEEGRVSVSSTQTVEKWLTHWLAEIAKPRLRPTTFADYSTIVNRHIIPALGNKRLDKLTPDHIRALHKAIGPSRTAELAHVVLSKALKDAEREGVVTYNVCERLDKPRYTKQKRTNMSVGVAKLIITTALKTRDESESTRWAAAFLTGARQSELLGLRWSYVDLKYGYMDISWQLQQLKKVHGCGEKTGTGYRCGKTRVGYCPQAKWDLPAGFEYEECYKSLLFTRPKTEAGARLVPIIGPLLTSLKELHDQQGANPYDLVWHHPDGRPIDPRSDNRAWNQLLVDAEILEEGKTLPLHLARHTAASLLRSAGVDEQTRMEILGHATVEAQRIYAHGDRERHLEAMGNLTQLMG